MVKRLFVALLFVAFFVWIVPVSAQSTEAPKQADSKSTKPAETPAKTPAKPQEEGKPKENSKAEPKVELKSAEQETEDPKPAPEEAKPKAERLGSERLLPASTKAWISIPDADELEKRFAETQFGLLGEEEALKPFAEHLKGQVEEWINDQNVRLNLKLDDLHGVHSGEICFAGVLPEDDNGQPLAGKHGLVFLMDVSETQKRAEELQVKINAELVKRGAKRTDMKIQGAECTKWVIENPKLFRQKRFNFQAIINGWMLVSNNEAVFREVHSKLANPDRVQEVETLAGQSTFKKIVANTDLGPNEAQIQWFVDPFGYIELAQQIKDDEAISKVPRDNFAQQLKNNGFDAFRGIGGNVAVNTGEHEILHRTFTVADRKKEPANDRFFDLFDFKTPKRKLEVPSWVADNASSIVIGNWDYDHLLGGVSYFFDVLFEADFERTLDDLKKDPQVRLDVRKMVSMMDDQLVVMSATEPPISAKSERVVFGVPVTGDSDYLIESLKRAQPDSKMLNLGGFKVVEIDTTVEPEVELPPFGVDIPDDQDPYAEEEEDKPRLQLFEKRYMVVANNWLLVTNDKAYLRKILAKTNTNLDKASDYLQVKEALAKLTVEEKVCWRQFGRLDASLQVNYEMLRKGEMANAQTVLARIVNWIAANSEREQALAAGRAVDPDKVRKQKIDGAKLPKDFEKRLAPYLGPVGSVMEVEKDGWRITGCFLIKKKITTVVRKLDEKEDLPDR